jgi:hypothetical protein
VLCAAPDVDTSGFALAVRGGGPGHDDLVAAASERHLLPAGARTVRHNLPLADMRAPVLGPALPGRAGALAAGGGGLASAPARNHRSGHVEGGFVAGSDFDQQFNEFEATGRAVDPTHGAAVVGAGAAAARRGGGGAAGAAAAAPAGTTTAAEQQQAAKRQRLGDGGQHPAAAAAHKPPTATALKREAKLRREREAEAFRALDPSVPLALTSRQPWAERAPERSTLTDEQRAFVEEHGLNVSRADRKAAARALAAGEVGADGVGALVPLAAGGGGGGGSGSLSPFAFDGRALLQAHPGALALDADELRAGLSRVLQLLPAAAREDPTGLAMAALSPLVSSTSSFPPSSSPSAASDAAFVSSFSPPSQRPSAERVALAYEELGAVVAAASRGGVRMGPRLFAWLFEQQQQQEQEQERRRPPSLAAGLAALSGALGGPELASAALERAPELALASGDAGELLRRVEWLRDRLGIVGAEEEEEADEAEYGGGGGGNWAGGDGADGDDEQQQQQRQQRHRRRQRPSLASATTQLLPARLAAALSTASCPNAAADRSIVSPARSTPKDPTGLPIRPAEALSRGEFAGAPPPHALPSCSAPLAVGPPRALDAAASAAARLLRRRAGWPPGAAVRFLRSYPGALAWDWSPGGPCDRAFAEVEAAAQKRGGRWPLALRTSPAAVAAALAGEERARRRLAYLGRAPGALPGVGLRRALAMPEVDFLEACPGYSLWRRIGMEERRRGAEEETGGGGAPAARRGGAGLFGAGDAASGSDLVLLGELRERDRML